MITIDRTILEQALDALEKALPITREQLYAIISLREALAQPAAQQEPAGEPVAHFGSAYVNENGVHITTVLGPVAIPQDAALYTRPAVPLSDEQIRQVVKKAVLENKLSWIGFNKDEQGRYTVPALSPSHYQLARAVEAAHKIGGAE